MPVLLNKHDRRQAYWTARAYSTKIGPSSKATQDKDQAKIDDAVVSTIRLGVTAATEPTTQVVRSLLNILVLYILTSLHGDGMSSHGGTVVSTNLPTVVETTYGVETMCGVEVAHTLNAPPVDPLRLSQPQGWVSQSGGLW